MDALPPPPPPRPDLPSNRMPVLASQAGVPTRPQPVAAAGWILIVLGVIGALAGLVLLSVRMQDLAGLGAVGDLNLGTAARGIGALSLVLGALQLAAGVLVLRLSSVGRVIAIVLAILGLLGSLGSFSGRAGAGVIALGLNGFVLYVLFAHAASFRSTTGR